MKAISDDRLESALAYLASTDKEVADLKANVARSDYLAKVRESFAFKAADGNNEERKHEARTADDVQAAWEKHFVAIADHEKLRAKRETEILVIETWRSLNANRRQGAIL